MAEWNDYSSWLRISHLWLNVVQRMSPLHTLIIYAGHNVGRWHGSKRLLGSKDSF